MIKYRDNMTDAELAALMAEVEQLDQILSGRGSMHAPHEQQYPEGVCGKFTIEFTLDKATGNYTLFCPEWRCELAGGQHPGHPAYGLIMEIVLHNAEEMRHANAGTVQA